MVKTRNIKFRAWDKERKFMVDWSTIKIAFGLHIFNSDWIEVMQFTGLRDRNGIDIYEGDILRFDDIPDRISAVVFNRGMFVSKHYIGVEFNRSEIIGNVYENPELIQPHKTKETL